MAAPPTRLSVSRRLPATAFDFTHRMHRFCADLIEYLPQLRHIDIDRVAIGFAQARSGAAHGLQATLTPLRFEGGRLVTRRDGRFWTTQRLYDHSGREMLYLLTFYLPRFLNLPFREKLVTVLHELWHVGPLCDGDLRRYPGRCALHGPSLERYDAAMDRIADSWLADDPPVELYGFLRFNYEELVARHGAVRAVRVPAPKLIELGDEPCPGRC